MAELLTRSVVATTFTVLFLCLGKSDAQCSIEYEDKAVQYQNEVLLLCLLPVPVKWWRSTEQCGDFIDHSSQCGSTSCTVHTNSSYFYYCCTSSTVSDVLVARDDKRRCFRIQVCIDIPMNSRGPPVAFFNEPVQIFGEMFSEPQPEQLNTTIILTHTTESQRLSNSSLYTFATVGDARLAWQYIVNVPDNSSKPSEGVLTFTSNFKHINSLCGTRDVSYSIPVRRKSGVPMQTEPPLVTFEPPTKGLSPFSNSERLGYLIAVVVGYTLCIVLFPVCIGFTAYHCAIRCQKRRSTGSYYGTSSSNNPVVDCNSPAGISYNSPGTTPLNETPAYMRENSAVSTSSTQPLLRDHPLSLVVRGAHLHNNSYQTNGHAATTTTTADSLSTPTPSVQSRQLPPTPDAVETPSSTNHSAMATIDEERAESANQVVFYERLNENVPLEMQQTDSRTVHV